ncbi:haloalkane dehalogenase [Arenicella sp. 4NH20-0111]|uniref:haloalkane dehalogenase n=1 Tax=Arenicella sp. 4NH20-0111 TaxID=3127648 RepID=UPI00310212AD
MKYLRTPDSCFSNLPEYDFAPNYLTVNDGEGGVLRLHYIDEGPKNGEPVLLMHGEPSWSFLYRKMVKGIVDSGRRVIAPDLIGFGRSDKPTERSDYTYDSHLMWIGDWLRQMDLRNTVLFCQDWGGLLGLRLVAAEPERFSGVVVANTGLPTGDSEPSDAFLNWREFSQSVPVFPVGQIIQSSTVSELSSSVVDGYDAPYPDETYKAGARQFPLLVPITSDDPASQDNRDAWKALSVFDKPFLTAFSDKDPVTAGGDTFFQKMVPGCKGQQHVVTKNGGHFLQEDKGEELAGVIVQFIKDNSL